MKQKPGSLITLVRLIREKKKKPHITNIKNKGRKVIIDSVDIRMIKILQTSLCLRICQLRLNGPIILKK